MAEKTDKQEFKDSESRKDVLEIHDSLLREQELPDEGEERGPWWLYATIMLTFAFGFFYMGYYFGEFSHRPHVLYQQPAGAGEAAQQQEELTVMEQGKRVYGRVCQACHQADGKGQSGVFPTLAGSPVVTGEGNRFAALLLHGMQGELVRDGETYNGNMPAWGNQLSDEEVAAVMTYVRSSFGNDAGEVPPETVKDVRENVDRTSQWTIEELNEFFSAQQN